MTLNETAMIRKCTPEDRETIYAIINDASVAYKGAIPDDCWHEPYMSMDSLDREIADGVDFWCHEENGEILGVMGIQQVKDVDLIRHAYVRKKAQGLGIGTSLLRHLESRAERPMLIGTWAAAEWAIRFYQRHGYDLVSNEEKEKLLRKYWTIPDRQIETSVVLAPHDRT